MNMSNDPSPRRDPEPVIPDHLIPPLARPASAEADAWINPDLERLERRLRGAGAERKRPILETSRQPVSRRRVDDIEIPDLAKPPRRGIELEVSGLDSVSSGPIGPVIPHERPASEPAFTVDHVDRKPLVLAPRTAAEDEVIDLPAGGSVADVVLGRLDVVMTPVYPPMLPDARLCVSRAGQVVLVAAASPGLGDLPTIGRAMTWATENRRLLRMALAQYRLDESADVSLHLLVSRADANADALRPLLSTGRVSVQTYRRLTWGGRSGVLLEAA
jgi:hypothetical protein